MTACSRVFRQTHPYLSPRVCTRSLPFTAPRPGGKKQFFLLARADGMLVLVPIYVRRRGRFARRGVQGRYVHHRGQSVMLFA
jgi:hypothetical protein